MTFTVKLRGAPTRETIADYECPAHGRFELTVERDENGNPPSRVACRELVRSGGGIGLIQGRCQLVAEFRISAPRPRISHGSVAERGSSDPMPPNVLDTRPLADGMSHSEWTARRRKKQREERLMKLPPNVRRVVERTSG